MQILSGIMVVCLSLFMADAPLVGKCAVVNQNADSLGEPVILRDKESKAVRFIAPPGAPWQLFAGTTPQDFDFSKPVLCGEGGGEFELPGYRTKRMYFLFDQAGSRQVISERLLPMSGGFNFRDLGGIRTSEGKQVRWGRLFRADGLSRLHPEDLAYLSSVPITTIVDFRTEHEAKRSPDKLPDSVQKYMSMPVIPGRLSPGPEREALFARGVDDTFMEDVGRAFVEDETIIATYKEFFQLLLEEPSLPLLFHCSAGKDRTGYAAALILFSLGVDKETIMQDYMASAGYLAGKYDDLLIQFPERAVLFTVKPNYLQASFEAMEKKSGSINIYLTEVLGIDQERMREIYLQ